MKIRVHKEMYAPYAGTAKMMLQKIKGSQTEHEIIKFSLSNIIKTWE